MTQAQLTKDEASILDAVDDRSLEADGNAPLLPYDTACDLEVTLISVKAKKTVSTRGVFVTFRVDRNLPCKLADGSMAPCPEINVGMEYTLPFFDVNKKLHDVTLQNMARDRVQFAATIAGVTNTKDFKASDVLRQMHLETEPLDLAGFRIRQTYTRTTGTGKRLHQLSFARAAA